MLEELTLMKDRINAQLDSPWINLNQENLLLDQLSKVCDKIDQLTLTEAELSVKRWMDRNCVPF